MFATIGITSTSSRMTYAFARDRGLPYSRFFAKVHATLDLPLNALYLTQVLVVIFGLILLGSSAALNAIISASVVALGVSYGIPIAINCLRGRKKLPVSRPFKLPPLLGWAANIVCCFL
jgi:choline transport protein